VLVQLSRYYQLSPEKISVDQVKQYLYQSKENRGLSNSFINQTISALKILRRDVLGLDWDEGLKIKRPRPDYPLPDILSRQEANTLIELTSNPKHKAILALLYSTGMRRDELINLRLIDIDSTRMVIRISNGKGNKARDALLAVKTLHLLRDYYRKTFPKPLKYVFEGGGKPSQPYSATSLHKIVKRAAAKAGIKKSIHIHSLRHAFATHMLEQGSHLKLIQKLLGHSSLRSTMVYLHLAAIDPSVKSPFDQP
jgi:site-specific recombinase XerD